MEASQEQDKHIIILARSVVGLATTLLKDAKKSRMKYNITCSQLKTLITTAQAKMYQSNDNVDVKLIYQLLKNTCGLALWDTCGDTLFNLREGYLKVTNLVRLIELYSEKIGCISSEKLGVQNLNTAEERTGRDLADAQKPLRTISLNKKLAIWTRVCFSCLYVTEEIFYYICCLYEKHNIWIKTFCTENLGLNEKTYASLVKMQKEQMEHYQSVDEFDPVILYKEFLGLIPLEDIPHNLLIGTTHKPLENTESAYHMFSNIVKVLNLLSARTRQNFYDIMAQMGKVLYPEAPSSTFSAQPNTLPSSSSSVAQPSLCATASSSSVSQPSSTVVTASTIVSSPSVSTTVRSFPLVPPPSSATVPSSSTVPPLSSANIPSSIIPPPTSTVPSSTVPPSSSSVLPSSSSSVPPSSSGVPPSSSSSVPPSSSSVPPSSSSSVLPSSSSSVPPSSSSSVPPSSSSVPPSSSSSVPPSSSSSVPPPPSATVSPSSVPPVTLVTAQQTSTITATTLYGKDDMNVVRVFVSLRRGGPAVKTFAKVFEELSPVPLSQLVEYNKNVLRCTGNNLKDLKKALRKPLEKNMKLTDLDITLLYMCLGYIGLTKQEEWSIQYKTLENYLYLVKMERNFLAHEAVCYTVSDFAKFVVDLPQWLESILCLVGRKCGKDMTGMITDIKKELNKIFKGQLPVEDIDDYHQRIQKIREALTTNTLAHAIKEIKEYYSHDRYKVVTPVTWCSHSSHTSWDVGDLYTELKIINSESRTATDAVSTCDLFSLLRSTTNVLVVEGAAGSGKTSFCKFAIQSWKNMIGKMNGLVDVDLLIFIQCRHVYSETLTTFLMQDLLKETFCDVDREDIILSLSNARLLFMFDGYDEARPAARTLLRETFTKFPTSAYIITTRPEFQNSVEKMIDGTIGSHKKTLLRIVGFEDTRREEYIRKLFSMYGGDPDPFLKHLKTIDKYLGSFTQLPLTLALLVLLWNDEIKKLSEASTVTRIYKEIVEFFQRKLVERQEARPKESRDSDAIEHKFSKWLQVLARIAWTNVKKNLMSLSKRDEKALRDECDKHDIDSTDALSCLLQCNITTSQCGSYHDWEFVHKTIEEFLAAGHLSSEIIEKDISIDAVLGLPQSDTAICVTENYNRLIQFIAGLLVEEDSMTEVRAQQVLNLFHFQLPWTFDSILDLSRECKSSSNFMLCLKNMFRQETLLDYLEGYKPDSLHYVLQETALRVPLIVTIKVNSTDADKMKPLLELLSKRGCFSQVLIDGDDPECICKIIDTLSHLPDPSDIEIIFSFKMYESFPTLIKEWPWPKPLYLQFHSFSFPMLWFVFITCLALHSVSPSRIIHMNPHSADAVRTLAERLGAHYGPYTTRSSGEVIVIGHIVGRGIKRTADVLDSS